MPKKRLLQYALNKTVDLEDIRNLHRFCMAHNVPPVVVYEHLGIHRTTFAHKSKYKAFKLDEIMLVAHLLTIDLVYNTTNETDD